MDCALCFFRFMCAKSKKNIYLCKQNKSIMAQSNIDRFKVTNLGPIAEADVEFGDLTILTGPQATGKTLFLETFKFHNDIIPIWLSSVQNNLKSDEEILDYYYGDNMHSIFSVKTKILENSIIDLLDIAKSHKSFLKEGYTIKRGNTTFYFPIDYIPDNVYYIPAQRSLALSEGRIKTSDDFINSPYVLRRFSFYLQNYVKTHSTKILKNIVPNYDFFNESEINMKRNAGSMRLHMLIHRQSVPYMAWSTGQRELAPLLMALENFRTPPDFPDFTDFIVIEEPELGLHPRAIIEFMLTVLKIMQTGTKVIISTHSSTPLDFVWTIKQLKEKGAKPSELAKMFDFKIKDKTIFDNLFEKTFKTYYFAPDKKTKKVYTKDISSLDVYSEDEDIATWGGMSLSADRAGSIVSRL